MSIIVHLNPPLRLTITGFAQLAKCLVRTAPPRLWKYEIISNTKESPSPAV
jgi:hypothetical protein